MIEPGDDPVWGAASSCCPSPTTATCSSTSRATRSGGPTPGCSSCSGCIRRDPTAQWRYQTWWAHDLDEEATAVGRADRVPGRAPRRLTRACTSTTTTTPSDRRSSAWPPITGSARSTLGHLVETGLFVDLLLVARNAIQVGTESYGLKYLERLTDYERGHEIDQGAGAVVEYERYMADRDPAALDRIASYNEDDVRATWPCGTGWSSTDRTACRGARRRSSRSDDHPRARRAGRALHAFGPGTPEHLLGDVLGYWQPRVAGPPGAPAGQAARPTRPTCSTIRRCWPAHARSGRSSASVPEGKLLDGPAMRFSVAGPGRGRLPGPEVDRVLFVASDGRPGYALDRSPRPRRRRGRPRLARRSPRSSGSSPPRVVLNDWVGPEPKPEALSELANRGARSERSEAEPVSMALLRRDLPAFVAGGRPGRGPAGAGSPTTSTR